MTSRNTVVDLRSSVNLSGTNVMVGLYSERNQNGTNNTPVLVNVPILVRKYKPVRLANGKILKDKQGRPFQTLETSVIIKKRKRYPKTPNNYTTFQYHISEAPITYTRRDNMSSFLGALSWNSSFPQGIAGSWTSNDELELISKLQEKINGSTFNAAVTLAESGESLRTITNGATRIFKALRALRHGDIPALAAHLGVPVSPRYSGKVGRGSENLTSTWLEYQYGWKPMLKDIHDATIYLANKLEVPKQKSYVVRKQKVLYPAASPSYKNAEHFRIIRKRIEFIAKEPAFEATYSEQNNPLLLAWELLPYSFVADWIYPVSSYLQARSFIGSLRGTFVTTLFDFTRASGPKSCETFILDDDLIKKFYGGAISMNRSVSTTYDVPLPNFVPLSEAISWKRAVSALSLLNNFNFKL